MSEAAVTDDDLQQLAVEMAHASPVVAMVPAFDAYCLAALLQLAWRHPGLSPRMKAIAEKAGRDLQDALRLRSPLAAATLELGWVDAAEST